jgi:hypothetical protein
MHLGTALPMVVANTLDRSGNIDALAEAGFPRVVDYNVRIPGTSKASNYAVAFKNRRTEARWHLTEAHANVEIRRRIVSAPADGDNDYPFDYFDTASVGSIEYPPKASAVHFCQQNLDENYCVMGHGMDPTVKNIKADSLKVQESQMGEHAGRGVYTMEDIPAHSYLGGVVMSQPVRMHWKTSTMVNRLEKNKIYDDELEIMYYYFEGYGFIDEPYVSVTDLLLIANIDGVVLIIGLCLVWLLRASCSTRWIPAF